MSFTQYRVCSCSCAMIFTTAVSLSILHYWTVHAHMYIMSVHLLLAGWRCRGGWWDNSFTCTKRKFDNIGKWSFPGSQAVTSPESDHHHIIRKIIHSPWSDCKEIIPSTMTAPTCPCADRRQAQTQAYEENCQRYRYRPSPHSPPLTTVS